MHSEYVGLDVYIDQRTSVSRIWGFDANRRPPFLHSLRHSGTLDYNNALGEVGTVYLPIPAGMGGTGKIQVIVQGRLKEIQAFTRHDQRIENRVRVRVVELLDDNTLLVEPLADLGASQEN